jgi:hypothetical protein
MKHLHKSVGFILQINGHFLLSMSTLLVSVLLWPGDINWWGLGVLSIIFATCSIVALIRAVTLMSKLSSKKRTITDFTNAGRQQKSSAVATNQDLEKAGMR